MQGSREPSHATFVGDGIEAIGGRWTFSGGTPAAFDRHIVRSVPFYAESHDLILELADHLAPDGSRCYDLGCSTGALTLRLAQLLGPRGVEVVGIDREPGMISLASDRSSGPGGPRFEVGDLLTCELLPASLAVAFYTLQFVPLRSRQSVVDRIREALEPGGVFLVFEKVLADSAAQEAVATEIHRAWKMAQGFTADEVNAKERSLRGVLRPQTSAENREQLRRAGFREVEPVFRWLGWEGLLARV